MNMMTRFHTTPAYQGRQLSREGRKSIYRRYRTESFAAGAVVLAAALLATVVAVLAWTAP